jgi:peptidoglycan hydrolase-like protein with peptidoglycan-binding domain
MAWLLTCALVGAAGAAAGWQLFGPGPVPEETTADQLTYTVQEGSVGRTATYSVHATRDRVPLGVVAAPGVVTALGAATGDCVEAGDELLRVDERPIVLVDGSVPSFRDLALGAVGEDVRQLQQHLRAAGYLKTRADGVLGPLTELSIKLWQRTLGLEADGVVRAGDVIFTGALPGWVELSEDVYVGARVEPGTPLGSIRFGDPSFVITVDDGQRRLPSAGDPVTIVIGNSRWSAVSSETSIDADGRATVRLHGADGRPVCEDECGMVPVSEAATVLSAEVVIVPQVDGPVVPVTALRSDPGGSTSVMKATGDRVVVEVLADDGGRAVVAGVGPGDVLMLFADEAS